MPLAKASDKVADILGNLGEGASLSLGIWTTTPWTIPANLAVAVNEKIEYVVARVEGSDACLVVAEDLVEALAEKFGKSLSAVAKVTGAELEGCTYKHPLYARESPVVIGGDYITTESGTGLVHTAPGHGQDDFIVGQK